MKLFTVNLRSQSCHALFLGVFGQCSELSDLISPQLDLPKAALIENGQETVGHRGKGDPEHTE